MGWSMTINSILLMFIFLSECYMCLGYFRFSKWDTFDEWILTVKVETLLWFWFILTTAPNPSFSDLIILAKEDKQSNNFVKKILQILLFGY